jgi:hypothetical protein
LKFQIQKNISKLLKNNERMKRLGLILMLCLMITASYAQDAQKLAGIWWNDKKTSKIEVKQENGKFIGIVVYINPEKYVNGEPEKDTQNPDVEIQCCR